MAHALFMKGCILRIDECVQTRTDLEAVMRFCSRLSDPSPHRRRGEICKGSPRGHCDHSEDTCMKRRVYGYLGVVSVRLHRVAGWSL